jgi:hypothetical protein
MLLDMVDELFYHTLNYLSDGDVLSLLTNSKILMSKLPQDLVYLRNDVLGVCTAIMRGYNPDRGFFNSMYSDWKEWAQSDKKNEIESVEKWCKALRVFVLSEFFSKQPRAFYVQIRGIELPKNPPKNTAIWIPYLGRIPETRGPRGPRWYTRAVPKPPMFTSCNPLTRRYKYYSSDTTRVLQMGHRTNFPI